VSEYTYSNLLLKDTHNATNFLWSRTNWNCCNVGY